ncbi:TBCC domain-containing protein 1-like [Dendronephthya gigantea]|uniref:TBCC domain-containing protein 1-like n=1 Tax=Dendronephthya gigantea TaxID=151771 RepID=UPI00106CD459|nr:TBCC domain-containing protein 1-like [Dendronephthya gigantea]
MVFLHPRQNGGRRLKKYFVLVRLLVAFVLVLMMNVRLWVRSEPFDVSTIQMPPPAKLTLSNLQKLNTYAKSKGDVGYPRLSYPVWKHVACDKFKISEELAWMYFATFDMVSEESRTTQLEWKEAIAKCTTEHEIEHMKADISVDMVQFTLFLYIQQVHKISLRESLVGGEEWPTKNRSPVDLERKGMIGSKSLDEHGQLMFVLNHLEDILELVTEPDSYSSSLGGVGSDPTLTDEAVHALGFLIAGSVDKRSVTDFRELAVISSNGDGYSKLSRTWSFRYLKGWIRSNLGVSPFGVSACLISNGLKARSSNHDSNGHGKTDILDLSQSLEEESSRLNAQGGTVGGRIIKNTRYAPPRNRLVIMYQICKQTVGKAGDHLIDVNIKVHRCHYSYIYLLAPVWSVTLEKCHNSTIVLGTVRTTVNVIGCENVTVIVMCNRLTVSGCSDCIFHVCTMTRPLLFGGTGNENLTFAPYYTHYPMLESHMTMSGLTAKINEWNNPLLLGHDDESHVFKEMDPNTFFTFSIPFDMKGKTKRCPVPLPEAYDLAIHLREKQVDDWHQFVRESKLGKPQRKQLQAAVQQRFQEWLSDSGNAHQLEGLIPSASYSR